jgi:hypothetical protein
MEDENPSSTITFYAIIQHIRMSIIDDKITTETFDKIIQTIKSFQLVRTEPSAADFHVYYALKNRVYKMQVIPPLTPHAIMRFVESVVHPSYMIKCIYLACCEMCEKANVILKKGNDETRSSSSTSIALPDAGDLQHPDDKIYKCAVWMGLHGFAELFIYLKIQTNLYYILMNGADYDVKLIKISQIIYKIRSSTYHNSIKFNAESYLKVIIWLLNNKHLYSTGFSEPEPEREIITIE